LFLNLARKVTLALTSVLFDVSLLLLYETKSNFPGEATSAPGDKTDKLAKSSKRTVQKNSLRGHGP
jgi:hypothetical protein